MIGKIIRKAVTLVFPGSPPPPAKIKIDHDLFCRYVRSMLSPDSIYVEIGAATGASVKGTISQLGLAEEKAYVVEACPENYEILVETLPAANTIHAAIGRQNGTASFFVVDDADELGTSRSNALDRAALAAKRPGAELKEVRVPAMTLERLFQESEIARCGLLFLNCEGAEYEIFHGDCNFLGNVEFLSLDLHKGSYGGKNLQEMIREKIRIYNLLEKAGFIRIGGHDRDHLETHSMYHLTSFWENAGLVRLDNSACTSPADMI